MHLLNSTGVFLLWMQKTSFFSPHTTEALFRLSTFELKWSTSMRTPPHYTPTAHEVFVCCYGRVIKKFNEFATHRSAFSHFNDYYRSERFLSSLNQSWQKSITAGLLLRRLLWVNTLNRSFVGSRFISPSVSRAEPNETREWGCHSQLPFHSPLWQSVHLFFCFFF